MKKNSNDQGFKRLLESVMRKRLFISIIVLVTFLGIIVGIGVAISTNSVIAEQWKELLLLLLGAFIGSYGKIIDYWFNDTDKDKMLVQKMDEEDGVTLSHTNDMKETNAIPTPIIPDAFIQGAAAASKLAVIENQQNYELAKDQQEHEQEMEKLEFEHHAHRQCEHVWGDADGDGHMECQNCGLLQEEYKG